MKTRMTRFTAWLVTAAVILTGWTMPYNVEGPGFGPAAAWGAEAAVELTGGGSYGEGDSVRITLTYSGSRFGSAVALVEYDSDVLEYQSTSGGEAYGGEGTVRITLDGGTGTDQLTCKIKFQARKVGESFVTATTSNLVNLDMEEMQAETRSVKVTVKEAGSVQGEGTEGKGSSDPEEGSDEGAADSEGDTAVQEAADPEITSQGEPEGLMGKLQVRLKRFFDGMDATDFLLFCIFITGILLLIAIKIAERQMGYQMEEEEVERKEG